MLKNFVSIISELYQIWVVFMENVCYQNKACNNGNRMLSKTREGLSWKISSSSSPPPPSSSPSFPPPLSSTPPSPSLSPPPPPLPPSPPPPPSSSPPSPSSSSLMRRSPWGDICVWQGTGDFWLLGGNYWAAVGTSDRLFYFTQTENIRHLE